MGRRHKGIEEMLKILETSVPEKIVERFVEVLEEETPLESMALASKQMGTLLNFVTEEESAELEQLMRGRVFPLFKELLYAYQAVGNAVSKLDELDGEISRQNSYLHSFLENSVVHISSDTLSNAGDYILVRSLRKLMEQRAAEKINWCEVNVRAMPDADFFDSCNRSSAVVLGGGGLFLKDSNENRISGWQWPCSVKDMDRIKVPIYVLGVGYNRFRDQEEFEPCFWESINALVEKSAFFGLRNHGSIRAVQGYLREDLRDKVVYHPCATTVISKLYKLPERSVGEPFVALNCAFDREELRYGNRKDEVMSAIARVCKKISESYKIKCYIHCRQDERVCGYLDAAGVPYEKVMLTKRMETEEYLRYFTEPELVLAIRGHAQMIPFGCKTPAVSMISHDKLKWFLEDIGHPEWGVEVLDPRFEERLLQLCKYMLENREKICGEIEEAQEKLWNIMQENLASLKGRRECREQN